jgi:hypothetical protein
MTSVDRKNRTEEFLQRLKIPINANLPMIEEESETRIRDSKNIARRILILTYLNVFAEGGDKKEIIDFLVSENLWEHVSPNEQSLFNSDHLNPEDKINISWRSEAIWFLLWAIQKVEPLDLPVEQCEIPDILSLLPDFFGSTGEFINQAVVRNKQEILDQSDLIYRLHWATRDAKLNNKPNPADLHNSIVVERHYAVNWLTYYANDWDDVTTDT